MILLLSLFGLLLVIAVVFLWRLWRAFKRYNPTRPGGLPVDLPTVSVCIPARNEMHVMATCLERVLASDYQKLEIMVYDDSSADDTSLIVRSFAHAGVRFVPGGELPEGWLGKNYALDVLAREASGDYVIFLDVDTAVKPTTMSQLVAYTLHEGASMVSVLPRREDGLRASALFGSLRYFWQLVFSSNHRPATSSALWLVEREFLLTTLDGFVSMRAVVEPEAVIALQSQYRAIISTHALGVAFEKKWRSQYETSRRLLYGTFDHCWWKAALGVVLLLLLNTPLVLLLAGVFTGWTPLQTLMAVILAAYGLLYSLFLTRMWARGAWLGLILWPIVVFQEFCFLLASLTGYALGTITWKGRPVIRPSRWSR